MSVRPTAGEASRVVDERSGANTSRRVTWLAFAPLLPSASPLRGLAALTAPFVLRFSASPVISVPSVTSVPVPSYGKPNSARGGCRKQRVRRAWPGRRTNNYVMSAVLIVDDDDLVRSVLARWLRAAGHETCEAADAESGLQ